MGAELFVFFFGTIFFRFLFALYLRHLEAIYNGAVLMLDACLQGYHEAIYDHLAR
jgi:hypothetical protein